jgi:hypothetical protein
MQVRTVLEPATSAVTVKWSGVLSTTWKSTDATASHWKYIIGNVIVYRDVYRSSSELLSETSDCIFVSGKRRQLATNKEFAENGKKGHENVVFAPSMVSMKKTIQQRQEPLSGSLAKRVSEEKL